MTIELTLDEITARELRNYLVELGEHQAAGAPIAHMDVDTSERLAVVIRRLTAALGEPTELPRSS